MYRRPRKTRRQCVVDYKTQSGPRFRTRHVSQGFKVKFVFRAIAASSPIGFGAHASRVMASTSLGVILPSAEPNESSGVDAGVVEVGVTPLSAPKDIEGGACRCKGPE
jgi:hypothetical protein